MKAATQPRDDPRTTRLLHVDAPTGQLEDGTIGDLTRILHAPDLLVVNDAATLPASLRASTHADHGLEVRLAGQTDEGHWRAVLFGAGDWRMPTEERPLPPTLERGDRIRFDTTVATIVDVDPMSPRLVTLAFDARGTALWQALYRAGRPVQYSYADGNYALWDVQTAYATRPWAVEPPSAGFAFTWDLLLELRRRGIGWARVTHAAGLSSTGDAALDARLPLAEHFEVPASTVEAIERTQVAGGRVVAVGTTVTRALEGAAVAHGGKLVAARGITTHRLGPRTRRIVVDGIVTGVHEAGSSHLDLLEAFAPRTLLDRAHAYAAMHGYRNHEFGDALAILAQPRLQRVA